MYTIIICISSYLWINNLKGVFAKNLRVHRLTAKNNLLSIASILRKLLRTAFTEERSGLTHSESCNIQ